MLINRYTEEMDHRKSDFFVACDYEGGKVPDETQRVLTLTQKECLQPKERQPMDRIPFVITYNTHATLIVEVSSIKERLAIIFNKAPLVACREEHQRVSETDL